MHAFELLNLFIAFYLNNQTIAGAARYESPRSRVKVADVTVPINSLVHVIQGSFVFPLQNKKDHSAPLLLCSSIPAITCLLQSAQSRNPGVNGYPIPSPLYAA